MPTVPNNAATELAASSDAARLAAQPNDAYRQNYNRFCRWVDMQDDLDTDDDGRYITRENVDVYFSRAIPNFAGQTNTIKTHLYALNWFSYYREYVGQPDFTVENATVLKGIETQAINRKNAGPDAIGSNPAADPHAGLKDGITEKDRESIMDYIYSRRNDDGPASFSHTWGWNAAVRTASSNSVLLSDLNMSYVFGPDDSGSQGRCLLLVLRKGKAHKDRHESDVQVGTWRHKIPKLCTVFATAKHVIWELQQRSDSINFFHEQKREKKRAPWWDERLLREEEWKNPANACKDILINTGVRTAKVTHHRTACLQNGGFLGLSPWQLNTLSHHLIEKQFKAYGAVVEKTAAKTLAGFNPDEPYFVARTHLELEENVSYYINLLLPDYNRWQAEANSEFGDKSTCADIFLNHLIPYFVEVVLQDSIYFVNHNRFSRRPFFEMIRNRVPGYDVWAQAARGWCSQKEADRIYDQVPVLNDACREAFSSILDKLDGQNKEIASLKTQLRRLTTQLSTVIGILQANGRQHLPQQGEAPLPHQAEEGGGDHGAEEERNDNDPQQFQDAVDPANDENTADEDAADDPPQEGGPPAPPQERRLTVNEQLGQGRMPSFPVRIPRTFLAFLAMWESNGLSEFLGDPMRSPGWTGRQGRAKREAWGKRKYIYRKICAQAEELMVSLPEAARLLDRQKGQETLGNWYKRIHGADETIARRNRLSLAVPRQAPPPPAPPVDETTTNRNTTNNGAATNGERATAQRWAWIPAPTMQAPAPSARSPLVPGPSSHLTMLTRRYDPRLSRGRGRNGQAREPPPNPAPRRGPRPTAANNRQFQELARRQAAQNLRRVEQEIIQAHGVQNDSTRALDASLIARLQEARRGGRHTENV